jgi:CheY-like chemotaxis protein
MSRKILLADDSVTIRKVVELTFMEEDYELTAVGDGREALTKLDEMVPDLVIADVHMGEVGGFEVCEEAKKKYPDVPVLLLVGTFEPFDRADVEKYGADAFLKKPFDSQDLLNQVGGLVESKPVSTATEGNESFDGKEDEPSAASEQTQPDVVPAADEAAAAVQESLPDEADHESRSADGAQEGLSDADVDRIARRVVELLSDGTVREVAWEVIPDMAEVVIKDRLRELEGQVE